MNLFERLLMRRLYTAANEGGDPGAGQSAATPPAAATPPTTVITATNPGATDPNKPADAAGKDTTDVTKTPEQLAAEQTAKEKTEKDTANKNKADKPAGAPEKYDFKAPEGVQLDPTVLGLFEPIAKDLGLTQEQAQKLVDIYPQIQAKQVEQWSQQVEKWAEDTKSDKEIGGDKLTVNVGLAQKALDTFGNKPLRALLDSTGIGNHPEVVRAFAKVGKLMSEDSLVLGGKKGGQLSAAEVLYGKK
jgi:hypothetical protein